MIAKWLVILSGFAYLGILFALAYWVERRARQGHSWVNNPYVYALSLAVYCTAWTYYGSVGLASTSGLQFLTIYLGPTVMAPLSWLILRKMIRICRVHRISSLADFISARYGKSVTLGGLVTLLCVLAIVPYTALQLQAISNSFDLLVTPAGAPVPAPGHFWEDSSFLITLLLAVFVMLFGTRNIDASVRREGMIAAIAFESVFKLVAFLTGGLFVTYVLFNGLGDIFTRAAASPELAPLLTLDPEQPAWAYTLGLSMLAILLLPRQFQVGVLENVDERHLNKAMWFFPLYLLVINLFVLPIGLAGRLLLPNADADLFLLSLPLQQGATGLALLLYLGGFAAATSMIIVSTISLSIMVSNNLLMPALVGFPPLTRRLEGRVGAILIISRRVAILVLLLLAFAYSYSVADNFPLVSLGLISFAGVAQFGPALLGGLYWKDGTKRAALVSISLGFAIWFYCLVVPTIVTAGLLPTQLMTDGPMGLTWLRPHSLLGLTTLDPLSHGVFWSLLINTAAYVAVSLLGPRGGTETYQAELFVDVFRHSADPKGTLWKGTSNQIDLQNLLAQFVGETRARRLVADYARRNRTDSPTGPHFVTYIERLLTGVIGAASARIVVASTVTEETITREEVYSILQESQQLIALNKDLTRTSRQLQEATLQLQAANQRLQELDQMKDDFISTITHEMRTPLTSIRAMAEILHDNPDLSETERADFLHTIIKESERMNRLINQVLDLERLETGVNQLLTTDFPVREVIDEVVESIRHLALEQGATLTVEVIGEPRLVADRDRIVQVLLNLISNALKFCDRTAGRIHIQAHATSGQLELSVWDNGRGVDAQSLPYIFDKFFQDTQQNLRKPKGSGLGLAISRRIVELHGGQIWAENISSGGARFVLRVPLASTLPSPTYAFPPASLDR